MKSRLFLFTLWAIVCVSPSFAARETGSSESSDLLLSAAPSVGLLAGEVGLGFSGSVITQVSPNFYIGAESGYHKWGSDISMLGITLSTTTTVVPITGTALYRQPVAGGSVILYGGASVGMGLAFGGVSAGSISGGSSTKLWFVGLARPGVEFVLSPSVHLSVEPKMGFLSDSFAILFQTGLTIAI